jgi:DNA-binding CsgD family transcriptional regulator
LLTEPERILFRRLAVFMGGFDLDAAQAVGGATDLEAYQVLDQLSLLVDKSLVVADDVGGAMRYRLPETVRQYALERLGESGEADNVRTRHRDYYASTAAHLELTATLGAEQLMAWADVEIDNLRAAYTWSRENSDPEAALGLVSSLHYFWVGRGHFWEGLAGFDGALTDQRQPEVAPKVWARAVADRSILASWVAAPASLQLAQEALGIAREVDDPALIAQALIGCGLQVYYDIELAQPFFAEAIDVARELGDRWILCRIRTYQAYVHDAAGDPVRAIEAAEEGRDIADALGDQVMSRTCRTWLGMALWMQGNLAEFGRVARGLAEEAEAAGDLPMKVFGLMSYGHALAHQGEFAAARAAAQSALETTSTIGGFHEAAVYTVFAKAALAGGDATAAREACDAARRHTVPERELFIRAINPVAEASLACGELVTARRWVDDTIAVMPGWHRANALTVRAFVALAQAEPDRAAHDAFEALAIAARTGGHLCLPDTLECLARLGGDHRSVARLCGAARAIRQRAGQIRFPMYSDGYHVAVTTARDALGQQQFEAAWAEGAALSTEEAIAYAQRGRGERKRPTTGWESLTPTERDVVRLVREGLGNKDIATRLFISARTVQTHLTHVYAKLGLESRVQLAQEAARHT